MEHYRNMVYGRQDSGIRRVVTALAGSYTSLQLPVTICNEQYKAVIDVGLPTSLISTAVWQKVSSPLYPINNNDITERVVRRTNLQLMGSTHFELQVGSTLLRLEEALVYDYDEPEIFLNISAVAALGLVIDFQEGTFGLRSEDGLRCNWNEDTLLFPDSKLANVHLLKKQKPGSDGYYGSDFSGDVSDVLVNSATPFGNPGTVMGPKNPNMIGSMPHGMPLGMHEMSFDQMGSLPSPISGGPMVPYPTGPASMGQVKRQAVNFKKLKNFYYKNPNIVVPIDKNSNNFNEISNWKLGQNAKKIKKKKINKNPAATQVTGQSSATKQTTVNPPNSKKTETTVKNQSITAKGNIVAPSNKTVIPVKQSEATADKDKPDKKPLCVNCKSTVHTLDNCTKPIVLKCVYCGITGHLRMNCPTVLKTTNPGIASSETLPGTSASVQTSTPEHPASENSPDTKDTTKGSSENAKSDLAKPAAAVKRPATGSVKVVVKKRIIVQGSGDASTQGGKVTGTKKVIKKIIKRVVKKPNTSEVQATDTMQKPAVVEKKSDGTPVPESGKEATIQEDGKSVPNVQKDVTKNVETNSTPVPDADDLFKKPEVDLIERIPVKRVVAKKNIKLNMLTKPASKSEQVGTLSDSEKANASKVVSASEKSDALKAVSASEKSGAPKSVSASEKSDAPKPVSGFEKSGAPKSVSASEKSDAPKPISASKKPNAPAAVSASEKSVAPTTEKLDVVPTTITSEPKKPTEHAVLDKSGASEASDDSAGNCRNATSVPKPKDSSD